MSFSRHSEIHFVKHDLIPKSWTRKWIYPWKVRCLPLSDCPRKLQNTEAIWCIFQCCRQQSGYFFQTSKGRSLLFSYDDRQLPWTSAQWPPSAHTTGKSASTLYVRCMVHILNMVLQDYGNVSIFLGHDDLAELSCVICKASRLLPCISTRRWKPKHVKGLAHHAGFSASSLKWVVQNYSYLIILIIWHLRTKRLWRQIQWVCKGAVEIRPLFPAEAPDTRSFEPRNRKCWAAENAIEILSSAK